MSELTQADYDRAVGQGETDLARTPRARAARYDVATDRLVIDLVNGAVFAVPPGLLQGFDHATQEQIAMVELAGSGFGLHWEELDADFTVAGLLAGRFGTARYMAERFGSAWDVAAAE